MSSILVFSSMILANVTYHKDVRPVFEKRCAQCHNERWPDKNWMDYEKAFTNREKIKRRVESWSMPPNGNMPKEERALVKQWVDQGAKR